MAELRPYPFPALIRRMMGELDRKQAIFDLPASRFFSGHPDKDLSVLFHGHKASSPLGPAAGPQTQMAQNIVLSWLAGSRIQELKTVQIMDELEIPRPCIDMRTVGFNAEWSQELKLEESLTEYVKGSMLVEMLRAGAINSPDFDDLVFDMSVGYDLAGIRSDRVQRFIGGMLDASDEINRLRKTIPEEYAQFRDLDFSTRLSNTITLSTFHGCPPNEIESIMEFLMRDLGINAIVKFNPMLLGPERARELLHEVLGYRNIRIPDSAFERDATWEQAVEMVGRLGDTAAEVGVGFGVKFSNTLIVENAGDFLPPEEKEVYLSGQPLHVLAMELVRRFRRTFDDRFPISFSAGIDRFNFADAAAIGLVPVTVCTDLLRKGGYGRLKGYYEQLFRRMDAVAAADLRELSLSAYGNAEAALRQLGLGTEESTRCLRALAGEISLAEAADTDTIERWESAVRILNTESYVNILLQDERYSFDRNNTEPRKIGSHLELFDCVTCDLCIPVCPNDANFTYGSEQTEVAVLKARRVGDEWKWTSEEPIELARRHQIANFADFCNDCGNCDIFCPEDGGPYAIKPRFFGREDDWRESQHLDGFFLAREQTGYMILGRFDGAEYSLRISGDDQRFSGNGFDVSFTSNDPQRTIEGDAETEIDFTYCHILEYLRHALFETGDINYLNSLDGDVREHGPPTTNR